MKRPLSDLRIVELGSDDALNYCGKLFADFGAEVIKIEPPEGDRGRALPPLVDIGNNSSESAVFAWQNTNKLSVTADINSAEGIARIRALLADADLLIDGRSARELEHSPLPHSDLRRDFPGLAITGVTWFGEHGPYRDYAATDAVARSLSGSVKLCGPAEGPPILPREGQVAAMAGLTAFIPSLAGLFARAETGSRRYAVSKHEAMLQITEFDTAVAWEAGFTRPRIELNRFGRGYPLGNFETKDGWLGVTVVTPAQWVAFAKMIGRPELGTDPRFDNVIVRHNNSAELAKIFKPALMAKTAAEWFEDGLKLRLPLAIVPTMDVLLKQQHLRDRGAFGPVTIGDATFEGPVLPQYLTRTRPKPNGPAPLAGQHNDTALTPRAPTATRNATPEDPLPLRGVRVIDLTMGWAGPTATRQLGDQGAEIIKVESCQYPDWFRGTDPRPPYHVERMYEKAALFQPMNRNKRGTTLNLTDKRGLDLLKRLLAEADAVIDNYAADVLPRMGLDAAAMHKINPRLVVVTMPAFGMTGEWSGARAYGSTLEQASGLPSAHGRDGDVPTMLHTALGDPVGGLNAAAALLLGLTHQKNTGEGQHIDLSQVECMLPLGAPFIIEQSVNGSVAPRLHNRHERYVPHGCFPAIGEDQWVTIAVRTDAEWQKLCTAMHRPDLAADAALATVEGRRAHEDRVEAAVKQWTMTIRPDLVMVTLQELGVPAGTARAPADLPGDTHLVTTGHWQPVNRPFIGPHLLPAVSYREGTAEKPYTITNLAPTLGQHTREVLSEILGLSDTELDELERDDVIGTVAVSKTASPKSLAAE